MNNSHSFSLIKLVSKSVTLSAAIILCFAVLMPTIIFIFASINNINTMAEKCYQFLEPQLIKTLQSHYSKEDINASLEGLGTFGTITYLGIYNKDQYLITSVSNDTNETQLLSLPSDQNFRKGNIRYNKFTIAIPSANNVFYLLIGINIMPYISGLTGIYIIGIIAMMSLTALVLIFFWKYIKSNILSPIEQCSQKATEFLQDENYNIIFPATDDEMLTTLANNINMLIKKRQEIIHQIQETATQLTELCNTINSNGLAQDDQASQTSQAALENIKFLQKLSIAFHNVSDIMASLATQAQAGSGIADQMKNANQSTTDNINAMNENLAEAQPVLHQMDQTIQQTSSFISNIQENSTLVASSMQNMTRTVDSEKRISQDSMSFAKSLFANAQQGMEAIQQTCAGIDKIQQNAEHVSDAIKTLNKHTSEISTILGIINEVSQQTTLLALNASIIAVQAGEHGHGFNIIAQELANLANSTETAAHNVEQNIARINQAGNQTFEAMAKEQELINESVKHGNESVDIFNTIKNYANESAELAKNIATSANNKAYDVQEVTNNIEGISEAVQNLNIAAQDQISEIQQLKNYGAQAIQQAQQANSSIQQQIASFSAVETVLNAINTMVAATKKQQIEQGALSKATFDSIKQICEQTPLLQQETKKLAQVIAESTSITNKLNTYLEGIKA